MGSGCAAFRGCIPLVYACINGSACIIPTYLFSQTVDEHNQLSFAHIMKHWKRSGGAAVPATSKHQPAANRNVLLRFYPPQSSLGKHLWMMINIACRKKCEFSHGLPDKWVRRFKGLNVIFITRKIKIQYQFFFILFWSKLSSSISIILIKRNTSIALDALRLNNFLYYSITIQKYTEVFWLIAIIKVD